MQNFQSIEQYLENPCTRFEYCSYYSLEVVRDLKRKFGLHAKLPLFSDPTIGVALWVHMIQPHIFSLNRILTKIPTHFTGYNIILGWSKYNILSWGGTQPDFKIQITDTYARIHIFSDLLIHQTY